MKPCPQHEEALTLMAADAAPQDEMESLQHHLESCAGCRDYWVKMKDLCRQMGEPNAALQAVRLPDGFRTRLRQRLTAEEPRGIRRLRGEIVRWGQEAWAWLTPPRFVMAAGMAICLMLLILVRPSEPSLPARKDIAVGKDRPTPPPRRTPYPPQALFAYQRALRESPEALDALVAEQVRNHKGGEGMTWLGGAGESF